MRRRTRIVSAINCLVLLLMAVPVFPQEAQAPSLFFREDWKEVPTGLITPDFSSNPKLELKIYGPGGKDIQVQGSKTNPPHVWTGTCTPTCALALRHKDSYVDLTGLAKIKWLVLAQGFHFVRPIVKLADGTWLVGDHGDGYTADWHVSEFSIADVRWRKLDIDKVVTVGDKPFLEKPDLTRVDEIGFAELMPGSGHGSNGWVDVGWIEVYGKAVKRDAAAPKTTAAKAQ